MSASGSIQTHRLTVTGMSCGHCVSSVEKSLLAVPGVRSASVDLTANSAAVVADPGIQSSALAAAVEEGLVDELGPDGTGLVQEKLPARGNSIVRVEILNGKFLYAIRLQLQPGSFNLCPADYCDPARGIPNVSDLVSGYIPPAHLIDEAARIIKAAHADVGGVEYVVNDLDGQAYFYDINALSNFVADAANVVGFDPFVQLVDFIEDRAKQRVPA